MRVTSIDVQRDGDWVSEMNERDQSRAGRPGGWL